MSKQSRRKKFDYDRDRKKVRKQFRKREAPKIQNSQIRNAWDLKKSVSRNMQDMGLALDPNRALPIKKRGILALGGETKAPETTVIKPYVLNQLEEEASLPEKNTKTLSSDLVEYVQYMIREHKEDHKAMARDEKNYYQDTPKQIKRKISEYKRCHPEHYAAFLKSLGNQQQTSS